MLNKRKVSPDRTSDPTTPGWPKDVFIPNCSLRFSLQSCTFAADAAKVAFTITHLTQHTQLWGTAEWEHQSVACSSFHSFIVELHKAFGLGEALEL